jgi:hypothetical protein
MDHPGAAQRQCALEDFELLGPDRDALLADVAFQSFSWF